MKNKTIALWILWTLGLALGIYALNRFESTTDDTYIGILMIVNWVFSVMGALRLKKLD